MESLLSDRESLAILYKATFQVLLMALGQPDVWDCREPRVGVERESLEIKSLTSLDLRQSMKVESAGHESAAASGGEASRSFFPLS